MNQGFPYSFSTLYKNYFSNARYFLAEVQPFIINSILRSFGCFSTHKKIDIRSSIWKKVVPINETEKLSAIHHLFMTNDEIFRRYLKLYLLY
jgi:hypothetical protein